MDMHEMINIGTEIRRSRGRPVKFSFLITPDMIKGE